MPTYVNGNQGRTKWKVYSRKCSHRERGKVSNQAPKLLPQKTGKRSAGRAHAGRGGRRGGRDGRHTGAAFARMRYSRWRWHDVTVLAVTPCHGSARSCHWGNREGARASLHSL